MKVITNLYKCWDTDISWLADLQLANSLVLAYVCWTDKRLGLVSL